jgi:excisionase family DNA binding protein
MRAAWNIPQVARKLGVTQRTVFTLLKKGQLPAAKIGNQWRFDPSQIEALFQSRGGGDEQHEPAGKTSAAA